VASQVRVVDCNEAAVALRRAPDKAAFRQLTETPFLTSEEQLTFCDVVAALARGGTRSVVHGWARTYERGKIYVRDSLFVPEQHRRTWAHVIHTTEDWTEHKRSEDALRESEDLLKQAARIARIGHWVWDEVNDRCEYCSQELARIHGLSVEEYYETITSYDGYLERVHLQDRMRYTAVVEEAYRQGKTYDVEFRMIRKTGEIAFVRELGGTSISMSTASRRARSAPCRT
jgi:PAS domain-containing protein